MDFLYYPIEELPFLFLALMVGFTLHEYAHAYFADRFGDPTARHFGRVTLNPMAHLDVLGTLLILLAGFGWAKPVPVDRSRFKRPRLMSIIVSAAGPLSNLLIAFVAILLAYVLLMTGIVNPQQMSVGAFKAVGTFFHYMIMMNLLLFVFNLIPLPPLDGYRVVKDLLPLRMRIWLGQYEHWGAYIFLLLVFIPPLSAHTIRPVLGSIGDVFLWLDGIVSSLFGVRLDWFGFFNR
ncbi:site-2 protease family protein [Paenibacillus turpanensis]|uniref:site-2 protease family protein n=1 Tax=Paenibacillus turpanensis TaxID=2689078 RepID=UPI00140BFCB6|nr:site-2 protease family protein [Paenibacillus turpanensis]